jgi:ATP-dependent protease HslVU (ClpYQ) peptidase subunit
MTTVAALALDGEVYMAADSCTNVYERQIIDGARKIRRLPVGNYEALMGVCGSGGLADLVAYRLELDDSPGDHPGDVDRWAATVAQAVTELAVEAGLTEGGHLDGHLLLGFRGRLWTIVHSQAIPIPDGVAALGSGEGPAMGVLDTLLGEVPPSEAVHRAVQVACNRDRNSRPPIYVEALTPQQP